MPTYAAYTRVADGTTFRLGTFPAPKGSVRIVTAAFAKRHPNADLRTISFARRLRGIGGYFDGPRVPADPAYNT